mmetsp:Transcript_10626/g.21461  ORF Transcript_10626/g.21461 Transcript_10626/m.21461 type:complete len:122 (-) Transcript_10626:984-1349(-)
MSPGGRGVQLGRNRWESSDKKKLWQKMSTGEAKASGMTDDDIRRVKDSEPRWEGEENMLFRNFRVNYGKSATLWLASNNGTAAGVGAATVAERDDAAEVDDDFMPRGAPGRVRFHEDGKLS